MDDQLRLIWSRALECDPQEIDNDMNFFEFGGDSVKAIQVIAEAGSQNILLDVEDLTTYPTIGALSSYLSQSVCTGETSALSKPQASSSDKYNASIIEEPKALRTVADRVAPVGPAQRWLLELNGTGHSPPLVFVYELKGKVDENLVVRALKALVAKHPILRTTWAKTSTGFCQVLLRECQLPFSTVRGRLDDHTRGSQATVFVPGEPNARYALVYTDHGLTFLTITIHHAFMDAFSRALLERDLVRALQAPEEMKRDPTPPWYGDFALHLEETLDVQGTLDYWRRYIEGSSTEILFRGPSDLQGVGCIDQVLHHHPTDATVQVGTSTAILGAWALALAAHCGLDDFVFAVAKMGRNFAYPGIDQLLGPLLAASMFRFRAPERSCSTQQFLQEILLELSRHGAYEPGLATSLIRQLPSAQCRVNIRLGTPGLPQTRVADEMTIAHRRDLQPSQFTPRSGIYLLAEQHPAGIHFIMRYQRKHVNDDLANSLFNNFARLLARISASPTHAPISEIIKVVDNPDNVALC